MSPSAPHTHARHIGRSRRVGRLPRWQRLATYTILSGCALSGVLFFMAHEVQLNITGWATHDLLVLHGISANLALLAFGAVMPAHIRAAWTARRNRRTGVLVCGLLGTLMASGLWLYYGSEDLRAAAVWSHWVIGSVGLVLFPLHCIWGRRSVPGAHPVPSSPWAQNPTPN